MDDKERLKVLEQALAQMLKPVRGIPFSVIVKSLAERQVILPRSLLFQTVPSGRGWS